MPNTIRAKEEWQEIRRELNRIFKIVLNHEVDVRPSWGVGYVFFTDKSDYEKVFYVNKLRGVERGELLRIVKSLPTSTDKITIDNAIEILRNASNKEDQNETPRT
jgi:hypothetical protein